MSITSRPLLILALAGMLLGGCTESQRPSASGKGTIRGVHAISAAPDVTFLIEERSLGTLTYKGGTGAQPFDDLTYNFNFDLRLPGEADPRRLVTETLTVVPDVDYVFVLTGSLDQPAIVLWETPERVWDEAETALEASAGHVAPGLGTVDVYLAAPGTAPVIGEARGSLAFGEKLAPFEVEAGDYVLTLTPAGDPANLLFRSNTQALAERTSVIFTIQAPDPSITSNLSVQRVTREGTAAGVVDNRFPPTRRFFHAAQGTAGVDVVADDDFATPVVSNLTYGALSADVAVPVGESSYAFTQAGNPGGVLLEEESTAGGNTRSTAFLVGAPGDLDMFSVADDRRPVSGLAKLRMTLLSQHIEEADLWLLEAGTDLADASPNFPGFDTFETTGYLQLAAGEFELSVTFGDDDTVAVGPVPVDLANGDIVELAIIDTADPNVLDVVVYDP